MNDKTEVGLSTMYNFQTSNVALGLVGKYTLEDGAVMKVGGGGGGYTHLSGRNAWCPLFVNRFPRYLWNVWVY